MIDFLGTELKIGDAVLFVHQTKNSAYLKKGIVSGLTEGFVRIEHYGRKRYDKVVKPFTDNVKYLEYIVNLLDKEDVAYVATHYIRDGHTVPDDYKSHLPEYTENS